jgi:hypothetical protein
MAGMDAVAIMTVEVAAAVTVDRPTKKRRMKRRFFMRAKRQ